MQTRTTIATAAWLATTALTLPAWAQPLPPPQPIPSAQPQPNAPAPAPSAYPQGPGGSTYPQAPPPQAPPQSAYPQGPAPSYPQGPGASPYSQGPAPSTYPPAQTPSSSPQGAAPQSSQAQPTDGSADTFDSPSRPAAQSIPSQTDPDLTWYRPIKADLALEDRSHERFLTALMNGHAFAAGPIRGMGSEVLGAFNFTSWFGAAAGVYLPNASFVAGVDFLRYSGITLPTKGRSFGLTILLPTIEARYAFSPGLLYLGSGLTGVRFTACPVVIDVRLPTVTVWQPLAFEEASKPSISVGATTSVAFMF